VVKLSVDGAKFWLNGESTDKDPKQETVWRDSVRMILSVKNPDIVCEQAFRAGAVQIFPVQEDFGWRLGRLINPF
jgi:PhnB protein